MYNKNPTALNYGFRNQNGILKFFPLFVWHDGQNLALELNTHTHIPHSDSNCETAWVQITLLSPENTGIKNKSKTLVLTNELKKTGWVSELHPQQ